MRVAHATRGRFVRVLLLCLGLLLLTLCLAPLFGSASLDLQQALDFSRPLSENPAARVLLYGRVPRVLAAAVAGAALAAAGVAFQALLRNPLADPFTLGVSSGSSLGAVLAIRLGLESLVVFGLPLGELVQDSQALSLRRDRLRSDGSKHRTEGGQRAVTERPAPICLCQHSEQFDHAWHPSREPRETL